LIAAVILEAKVDEEKKSFSCKERRRMELEKASRTSLIDASSRWDRVAEGEASASGTAMSTETCKIASQQKSKTLKSLQVNQKVNKNNNSQ
jgi:hypothetical protein